LRALPELRRADAAGLALAADDVHRKHCLAVVACECGFASWDHAKRVLDGDPHEKDFGTLLYDHRDSGILNHWFASYDEARALLDGSSQRYLLAYARHFFVVDRHYVQALGMDPDDPDWAAIGWDWVRPADRAARRRLYHARIAGRRVPR
jgi:hypothetical protein